MSAQRKMDMRNFFSIVRKNHHLANLRLEDDENDEELDFAPGAIFGDENEQILHDMILNNLR